MNFQEEYNRLNPAQREAVDTIEGPVLVIAGPGTGKTQLLSARVAHILQKTDSLPSNILCITFTESGAAAMRERLVSMIGEDAYRVGVYTFHGFCLEIINRYNEHFFSGAPFSAIDELTSFQMLEELFLQLPHSNKLSTHFNEDFVYLPDTRSAIAELKQAGLTPNEVRAIIATNQQFIKTIEPKFSKLFDTPRLSKAVIPAFVELIETIQVQDVKGVALWPPLATLCRESASRAIAQSEETNSTKPITAWRNEWLEKNHQGTWSMKDDRRGQLLSEVADIYEQYLKKLQEKQLLDFDDMILQVVLALEQDEELRFKVQEQFQYILIDEFQDTNGAQLRIMQSLGSNPVNEGRPNILAVGDDDQAIYAFQGAQVSNMRTFAELWQDTKIVDLNENYRSTQAILNGAHEVGEKIEERISRSFGVSKQLQAKQPTSKVAIALQISFLSPQSQQQWVTQRVQELIASGIKSADIAILAPRHKYLQIIARSLMQANIPLAYERRDNVLQQPHIAQLVQLAQIVQYLVDEDYTEANALLPEILSYPFWNLKPQQIWRISLEAYRQSTYEEPKYWLEIMLESEDTKVIQVANWLLETAQLARFESLEHIVDELIGPGIHETGESFNSPFRSFYFSNSKLHSQPTIYLELLSNLRVLRQKLREFRPDQPLKLRDLVEFVRLHKKTGINIIDTNPHLAHQDAVELMTAYKSKGLEFHTVFIIEAQDTIWGEKSRTRPRTIKPPHNLPIERAGESSDDKKRLLYVAMTRAKQQLYISSYQYDDKDKLSLPVSYLNSSPLDQEVMESTPTQAKLIQTLEFDWRAPHLESVQTSLKQSLHGTLEDYQLSSTHLNNFIDIAQAGPQTFLLHNLLQFPTAMGPSAGYGSAIHAAIHKAHVEFTQRRKIDISAVTRQFMRSLKQYHLNEVEEKLYTERGIAALSSFFEQCGQTFGEQDKSELSFRNQGVLLGKAHLSGAIDKLVLNETNKTALVVDYKTGKAPLDWVGKDDFERIKLHKYKQQLIFYKLLVENSRDFSQYTVTKGQLVFVEPSVQSSECVTLEYEFTSEDVAYTTQLISAVWQKILALDLPDTSGFEPNLKGIQAFERTLIDNYTS